MKKIDSKKPQLNIFEEESPNIVKKEDWEYVGEAETTLADYEHYIPKVLPDHDFLDRHPLVCVDTQEHLIKILKEHENQTLCAFDLETNSLDPEKETSFIIGVALCMDGITGYYVPIQHEWGGLGKEGLDSIYAYLIDEKREKILTFNQRFDFRWMEFKGYDMSVISLNKKSYDIQTGIFLSDTNISWPSLKKSEKHFLGVYRSNYEETLGDNLILYSVDAATVTRYAACLSGDTLIKTNFGDLTILEIRNYIESGKNIKVNTSLGENNVLSVLNQGFKDTIEIELETGKIIICTEDHKLLVRNKDFFYWKEAGKISENDELATIEEIKSLDLNLL